MSAYLNDDDYICAIYRSVHDMIAKGMPLEVLWAEVAAEMSRAMFGRLSAPVERLGGAACPVPFSRPLEMAFAPDAARIVAAANRLLQQGKPS